ncbi:TPR-like protein [Backusella circina FSU 941]|nr:TPR-like protein [Backusella circina FSU 941]
MWRAVAKHARQQIVHADPNNVDEILKLWYMRLLALTKLGLNQLASAEFEKLGDLNRAELKNEETGESFVPYELWILWGRLPFFLKFPSITLERLTMLGVHCKKMQKRNSNNKSIWEKREIQTYLILATHWIAMKEYSPAALTMKYILEKVPDDIDVLSGLGRLYLQMGDLESASTMFRKMDAYKSKEGAEEAIQINKGFEYIAKGEWEQARDVLEKVYQSNNENLLVLSNLAVCQVYLGQLAKAIEVLETLTLQNPTTAGTCETALNNLCTLYELRYEDPTEKKIDVVKQVARWTGDSFQPDCLKL